MHRFKRRLFQQFTAAHRLNVLALALVILVGVFVDRQNQYAAELDRRAEVQEQIGLLQTRLHANIYSNINLVQGLISVIMTEPDMDQQRFAAVSKHIFEVESQLRHIAAAPDMVIDLIYPMAGNEEAMGLNFAASSEQFPTAIKARDTGKVVLAGPLNLVQGGVSMIARMPVFVPTEQGDAFWGVVSAVIENQQLYEESGLLDPDLPLDIALVGKDGLGIAGEQFFGQASVLENDPVDTQIELPNGYWQLAAVPKTGWGQPAAALWTQRAIIVALGLLVMAPVVVAGHLAKQRAASYAAIQLREEKLQKLSRRLELALDASKVGVWDFDLESNELFWDDQMRRLYGIPVDQAEVSVDDWRSALHPDDRQRADEEFAAAVSEGLTYETEFRVALAGGAIRHIRAKAAIIEGQDGERRIVGLNWDITSDVELRRTVERTKRAVQRRNKQLEHAKEHIEHIALHDSLTGLPNRRHFDDRLSDQPNESTGTAKQAQALLVIDVDRFKQINDSMGHLAGDALLSHIAGILKSCIRTGDFIARIGGDEFAIVCADQAERQHLTMLAQAIIAKCAKPMEFDGKKCVFGVSIGIATAATSGPDAMTMMADADIALYQAKQAGRNRFEFFSQSQRTAALVSKAFADDILRGLEAGEFVPYYQTQHDAHTREIAGVETLIRWDHPEKGLLVPSQFLDIANEYGLTARLDHAMLEQTLADLDQWKSSGVPILQASVNMSADRLSHPELIPFLKSIDIEPGSLSFELLESIFMDDFDAFDLAVIDQIKALGIEIEIDDFGTGHSSIIGLLKIYPAKLKIDRQLVSPILESDVSRKMVQSVIEIGHSLNIKVVAEGVETLQHATLLADLGCDLLQGYAFSKPMPGDTLLDIIEQKRLLRA